MTFKGFRRLYVLVFLHVETRRVYLAPATFYPGEEWVIEQTKDFVQKARGDGLKIRHLVHDNDTKFTGCFRKVLRSKRIKPIRTPLLTPNMNAFVERFIQTVKQECLQHFIVLGERHLNYLLAEFRIYYHKRRPHQGRQNTPLGLTPLERRRWQRRSVDEDPELKLGSIHCERRLGGLLKHYYRDAA